MTVQRTVGANEASFTLGKKTFTGRFVIPSGIRCTRASTIELCFAQVEQLGIITTKSISLQPRSGYREPIYARYAQDCYINAVGLSNPGAEQFASELRQIHVPENKFLLVSIFGGDAKQFVDTALALRNVADGFELNMSCPHAKGYGVEIGQNCGLVAEITRAVVEATGLPIMVKLSAVVGDVGQTAKAAVDAGAAGITVSNTIGPGTLNLEGEAVLSNKVGGLSGTGIRPLALRGVRRVRDAVGAGPFIIGMGGISTADDVLQFRDAGADVFGVGSALTGMNSVQMRRYFEDLEAGVRANDRHIPDDHPPEIGMDYFPSRLVRREVFHEGLFKITLDALPVKGTAGELAGRYFFLFIPGAGEKPFAIFSGSEKSVVVRVAGQFTRHLAEIPEGTRIYLRGPYGTFFPQLAGRDIVLVGGGSGIASLLEIARRQQNGNRLHFLLGGRSERDLFGVDEFAALGSVRVATNDGSKGHHGFVSDLLAQWTGEDPKRAAKGSSYVVCGPEPMVEACFGLLEKAAPCSDVWGSIEYMTSCGVGICGKCACPTGLLTCIDGPFLPMGAFRTKRTGKPGS